MSWFVGWLDGWWLIRDFTALATTSVETPRRMQRAAVCEAATGLTFDVESTIASLHKLAPQLAEALLRACDTTESRAPGE